MHLRAIWSRGTTRILDGLLDDMKPLIHAWMDHGPPDALSLSKNRTSRTAAYMRIPDPEALPFILSTDADILALQAHFRGNRYYWNSAYDGPEELRCFVAECGLPTVLAIRLGNHVLDAICLQRQAPLTDMARLLALSPGVLHPDGIDR